MGDDNNRKIETALRDQLLNHLDDYDRWRAADGSGNEITAEFDGNTDPQLLLYSMRRTPCP